MQVHVSDGISVRHICTTSIFVKQTYFIHAFIKESALHERVTAYA